jgi:hypothetical protein
MGVRHGAGGAAGLPRSIEVYALPRNCAIERNEAGSVFDGVRPAGAARLPGSSRFAFQRLRDHRIGVTRHFVVEERRITLR